MIFSQPDGSGIIFIIISLISAVQTIFRRGSPLKQGIASPDKNRPDSYRDRNDEFPGKKIILIL
jgi:hypothetical protein